MVLKRLEMTGFKSFADRTVLDLSKRITGIVGPNGCGKSNIVDALRWVLGEQSARSLRGGRMEDIIFSGSSARAPLGYAEVKLTLENTDGILPTPFSEVAIGRRLFRSGESEYLINGRTARLKDIQNILMDLGMGKKTHSIIEQGKIEELVTSRPETRRLIFEEAAGVAKYRSRRAEAISKMESTRRNLEKVNYRVEELERREATLSRQSRRAETFLRLDEELRKLEFKWAGIKLRDLGVIRARSAESLDSLRAREKEANAEKISIDARLKEILTGSSGLRKELEDLREKAAVARISIEKIEADRRVLAEREASLSSEKDRMTAESARLEDRRSEGIRRLEALRGVICEINLERERLEPSVEHERSAREAIERRIEEARAEETDLESRLKSLEENIRSAERSLAELEKRSGSIGAEEESLRSEAARLGEKLLTLETETEGLRIERIAREEEKASAERESVRLKENLSALEDEERVLHSSARRLRERMARMEERASAAGKAREAWTRLMERTLGPETEYSRVGDLLGSMGEKPAALMAALASDSNSVLVKSAVFEDLASSPPVSGERIRIIDEGRVEAPLGGRYGLRPVSDLLPDDCPEKGVLAGILDGLYLVPDSATALDSLSRLSPHEGLVTPDGTIYTGNGMAIGGAAGFGMSDPAQAESAAAEAGRELEGVEARISEIDSEKERLTAALDASAEGISDLKAAIEASRSSEKMMEKARELAVRERDEKIRLIAPRTEELSGIRDECDLLSAEIESLTTRSRETESEISKRREEIVRLDGSLREIRGRNIEAGMSLSRLSEKEANITGRIRDIEESLTEVEEALSGTFREMERVKEKIADARAGMRECDESREERKMLLDGLLEEESRVAAGYKEVEERERDLREAMNRVTDEITALAEARHGAEMDLQEAERGIEAVMERMRERYEIEAKPSPGDEPGLTREEEERIEKLRLRLRNLGGVNFAAAEELAEARDRLSFYNAQKEDLERAGREIKALIGRMDSKTTEVFLETFNLIRDNFRVIFSHLFVGGEADLILTDEANPLDAGVEVTARPPGKRAQTISLLSGGEKAMTAVALLFSVFLARPSPFCVVDELDAPLDEANIGRFVKLLEEFSPRTQFMVVTHNKRTMEVLGAMYGVTMPEPGVSKLLAVEFEEGRRIKKAV